MNDIDSIQPLFLDGPLKAQEFDIPREMLTSGLRVPRPDDPRNTVLYHFHRFVLLGKVLWLGSVQTNFQAIGMSEFHDVFDVIVTDRAKRAM